MRGQLLLGSLAAISCGIAGCGGGSSPVASTTPAPFIVPTPTPRPRVTFSLEASFDHYRFSPTLARLSAGQSFELSFRPLRIDESPDSRFAQAVEVWLWATNTTSDNFTSTATCLTLAWNRASDWTVGYFTPDTRWVYTSTHVTMPLSESRLVTVSRRSDGTADFTLDGQGVLTLADPEPVSLVLTRVIGATAEFSYLQQPSTTAVLARQSAPGPMRWCGDCLFSAAAR